MRAYLATLLCAGALLLPGASSAQNVAQSGVRANATGVLLAIPSWNADCLFGGYPRVSVTDQPGHGSVKVMQQSGLIIPASAGMCAGKKVKGIVIYYTPKRDFRGNDQASFRVTPPAGGGAYSVTSQIIVN